MYAPSPYTYSRQGGGWGPGHGGGGPPAHLHLFHSSRPLFFTLYIRFMYIIPSKPQLYSFGVGRGRGHAKKPVQVQMPTPPLASYVQRMYTLGHETL
jgi:hypothetical protein